MKKENLELSEDVFNKKNISITQIKISQLVRKFSKTDDHLRHSVKLDELENPIKVVERGGFFHLVEGYERLRSLTGAGIREIPCVVISETEFLLENEILLNKFKLKKIDGIEICEAVYKLRYQFHTQIELAKSISRSKGYVSRALTAFIKLHNNMESLKNIPLRKIFTMLDQEDSLKMVNQQFEKYLEIRKTNSFRILITVNREACSEEDNKYLEKISAMLKQDIDGNKT